MSTTLATSVPSENSLLKTLFSHDGQRLRPHLEPVFLPAGKVLYDCGDPIRHVYFPLDSVIFLLANMEDGATAEVGVVGYEGVLGASVCMGADTTPNQAVVLNANHAVRLRVEVLQDEFARGGLLQLLMLRYMHALYIQVSQTAACNRIHHMEGRLCRWLLMVHDRLKSDHLPLTQEFIANMLGTHRPYVTVAAGLLQKEGVIHCQRGYITIRDRQGLESRACECYGIVREEYDRLSETATRAQNAYLPSNGVKSRNELGATA